MRGKYYKQLVLILMAELEIAAGHWPISCHLDQSMPATIMEGLEHGISYLTEHAQY